jgi:hypothetical protein
VTDETHHHLDLPLEDLERWRRRLAEARPSVVLREMADVYQVNRSTLGFFFADVWPGVLTPDVQAVWAWDLARNGKGLTDEALDALLAEYRAERPAPSR